MFDKLSDLRLATHSIPKENSVTASRKDEHIQYDLLVHVSERKLVTKMHNFWFVIQTCLDQHNMSKLCEYAFALAKLFTIWYDRSECNIKLTSDQYLQAARLMLTRAFCNILQQVLLILGITVINKM